MTHSYHFTPTAPRHPLRKAKPKTTPLVTVGKAAVVYGWAIVSTRHGAVYFNSDNAHVPEPAMLKAAVEFMKGAREVQVMHDGKRAGTVIHAFPLTADIAKAMGIASEQTGLMVGVQFDDPAILDKIDKGELAGFSPGWTGFAVPLTGE